MIGNGSIFKTLSDYLSFGGVILRFLTRIRVFSLQKGYEKKRMNFTVGSLNKFRFSIHMTPRKNEVGKRDITGGRSEQRPIPSDLNQLPITQT